MVTLVRVASERVLTRALDAQFRNRAAIARALGVARNTFHGWEHGRVRTPQPVRLFLSDLLMTPETFLFDEEGRAL